MYGLVTVVNGVVVVYMELVTVVNGVVVVYGLVTVVKGVVVVYGVSYRSERCCCSSMGLLLL